jgi:uncharacterized cupredoxin-like copper-binding protein
MKRTYGIAATAVVAVAVAGCGSSSSNTSTTTTPAAPKSAAPTPTTPTTSSGGGGGGASTVKLSADPTGALKFDKSTLTAKSGKVTIDMSNPSPLPHGVAVEGNGVDKDGQVVNKGGTSTVSVTLKPGKYTFYCPVPGHRQAGMQGTLTVQ